MIYTSDPCTLVWRGNLWRSKY